MALSWNQSRERIDRFRAGFRVATDILVFATGEVEFWRDSINHVVGRALREERLLYARPSIMASQAF